ncbi:hypothetical protein HYZ41_03010 [archaeon]|nr:hypothetical protein [archaeon]
MADHKSPSKKTWPETAEYIQKEGEILIPNSYWSKIVMITAKELKKIENPGIRKETKLTKKMMLDYPAQFVNLFAIGNRILVEPYGFGIKILPEKLKEGCIEVYSHDASKIKIGKTQKNISMQNYG